MLQTPKRRLGVWDFCFWALGFAWALTPNERKTAHLGSYQLIVTRYLAPHHLPIDTSAIEYGIGT